MPELPEVETIVRGLNQTIKGKSILRCQIFDKRSLQNSSPKKFINFVTHEQVATIKRFGKYIDIQFASGKNLVTHLRMTGKYIVSYSQPESDEQLKHLRILFTLSDNIFLLFKDVRLFGTVAVYPCDITIPEKSKLGVEPLSKSFTTEYLITHTINRSISIKQLLLEQKTIAGLGNIYVCEALFKATIAPQLPANQLQVEQAKELVIAIKQILKQALKYNGTSISDFRNVDDKTGTFQKMLKVYQREGEYCVLCKKTKISRIKQAQRSTFYCAHCQRINLATNT